MNEASDVSTLKAGEGQESAQPEGSNAAQVENKASSMAARDLGDFAFITEDIPLDEVELESGCLKCS
jgi:hypothetical protein